MRTRASAPIGAVGQSGAAGGQVDERKDVIRVPNAALRFYPNDKDRVREEDRQLFDADADEEEDDVVDTHLTLEEKEALQRERAQRYVWVDDGEFLRAVSIEIGLVGWKHSELVEGELKEGEELVVGERVGGE